MDELFRLKYLKKEIKNLNSLLIITLDALDNNTGTLSIDNTKDTIDVLITNLEKIILELEHLKHIFNQNESLENIKINLQEIYSLLKILDNGITNFSKHNIHFYDIFIFLNIINNKYKKIIPLVEKLLHKKFPKE